MKQNVTAVFDIGKTNKKFFLFDTNFKEVYKTYISFDEIEDEDGHPTENIQALHNWLKEIFDSILESEEFDVKAINFSTYGASFVHLDENGEVLTPLYNYTKEIDKDLVADFYKKYDSELELTRTCGSSKSGMLNSGIQLYWLKHTKPEIFKKIKYSLHLPQYLSYIFTGIPLSEYTSIGCHTSLWNYETKDYQDWVYKEEIHKIIEQKISEYNLQSYQEISGAGAVLNAILVAENRPAILLKIPKKENGGGSIWDFAATACIFKELGLVATNFDGEKLDLNKVDNTFMNHQGVFFESLS